MYVVDDRVVVQGNPLKQTVFNLKVMALGVIGPFIEYAVPIGPDKLIEHLQPETGSAETVRPNLGVLAVRALWVAAPLLSQVFGDSTMGPLKMRVIDPHHFKRIVPFPVTADVAMQ